MKQFTVYARCGENDEFGPAYSVTFTAGPVITCALEPEWDARARRMERALNGGGQADDHAVAPSPSRYRQVGNADRGQRVVLDSPKEGR
ncbi:MAG: hypothetical protein KGZ25_13315 [Planctomycetes bacterium]|nr:hypothetical protein [Planctomycetota bacterium]